MPKWLNEGSLEIATAMHELATRLLPLAVSVRPDRAAAISHN
jgi:hypothetical protein